MLLEEMEHESTKQCAIRIILSLVLSVLLPLPPSRPSRYHNPGKELWSYLWLGDLCCGSARLRLSPAGHMAIIFTSVRHGAYSSIPNRFLRAISSKEHIAHPLLRNCLDTWYSA